MAPSSLQHRRTHNILLISKLLNQRDTASPFTLILDSLEQSSKPLIAEYLKRAQVRAGIRIRTLTYNSNQDLSLRFYIQASKVQTILVSFETLRKPRDVDFFIAASDLPEESWRAEVANDLKTAQTQSEFSLPSRTKSTSTNSVVQGSYSSSIR